MGIFNDPILNDNTGSVGQKGQRGERSLPGQKDDKAEKGAPGIGFKLMPDGKKYDMDGKRIYNLDTQDDHKVDDDYNDIIKNMKSAVNKEYLNAKFLKEDKDENYFDLRQKLIRNRKPYCDGLFGNNDLVSNKFVK